MKSYYINFNKIVPYFIDIYTEIYGEEFHEIIKDRLNKAYYFQYATPKSIKHFISKNNEIKYKNFKSKINDFLNSTPILPEIDNSLNEAILSACNITISFESAEITLLPINYIHTILIRSKIESMLNSTNLTQKEKEKYFIEINKKLNKAIDLWNELVNKPDDFENLKEQAEILPKTLNNILERESNKTEFFQKIVNLLPLELQKKLKDKTLDEQIAIVVGNQANIFNGNVIIEFLSESGLKFLTSNNMLLKNHSSLVIQYFLKSLGITNINNENIQTLLKREDIKCLIPNEDFFQQINDIKVSMYLEAIKEWVKTRPDCQKILNDFKDTETLLTFLAPIINTNELCVIGLKDFDKHISILFFNTDPLYNGCQDFCLSHEIEHVIDQTENAIGFEPVNLNAYYNGNIEVNKYRPQKRKYEIFNETINDLFALEAFFKLRSKDLYLVDEPGDDCDLSINDINSSSMQKELLEPLYTKYRRFVLRAKINANSKELTKYIGEDNFEELIDAFNKIDSILFNSPEPNSKNLVILKEKLRIKKIYYNMDKYYQKVLNSGITIEIDDEPIYSSSRK